MVLIQWDTHKSQSNFNKHGVSFEEAATVLFDSEKVEFFDKNHSGNEDRFWIVGKSSIGRVLLVVYTWRRSSGQEEYYRIISARIAKASERRLYGEKS